MSEPLPGRDSREFARVEVRVRVRCELLDPDACREHRERIGAFPTVWAPRSEGALRDLATNQSTVRDGLLAQAVLDVAERLVRLESTLASAEATGNVGWIIELSGGGGRLEIGVPLEAGSNLLISFEGQDDVPPLRAIGEVVHVVPDPPPTYGFRFAAIHEADRDRLIRYLYRVQRRALRESHDPGEES